MGLNYNLFGGLRLSDKTSIGRKKKRVTEFTRRHMIVCENAWKNNKIEERAVCDREEEAVLNPGRRKMACPNIGIENIVAMQVD